MSCLERATHHDVRPDGPFQDDKVPGNSDEADNLRKQVATLAEFGKSALRLDDVDALLQEATQLVSDAIDVDLVKVLEVLPDGKAMVVRAGVNWAPGVVGHATIPANEGSAAGYALLTGQPVISDVATEARFDIPKLLIEHEVKSTVNVLVSGEDKDKPFGILEVDSREVRSFAQDDINFLQNYANLLSAAIKRVNAQGHLAESARYEKVLRHELQHRINNMLTTVRAVARRTRVRSQGIDDFAKSFDDRLAAIARTHALSGTETRAVAMRELLAQELSAHGAVEGENLTQRGPELLISARQAQALSMAFHELATNAVKHGALSVEKGHIDISWKTDISSTENQLHLRWRETGVTSKANPPGEASAPISLKRIYHSLYMAVSSEHCIAMALNALSCCRWSQAAMMSDKITPEFGWP
jgi:two-component sensor histidine kinase